MTRALDQKYTDLLMGPVRACHDYRPKFGTGAGCDLPAFEALYGADFFYTHLGLDNRLLFAAHRAAGGMSSVYRNLGTGCERLFREILKDALGLDGDQVAWQHRVEGRPGAKALRRALDGRITFADLADAPRADGLRAWAAERARAAGLDPDLAALLKGVVFEVRQGYKSLDSKRQQGDITNAAAALAKAHLPCLLVMSEQIDRGLVGRYRESGWVILTGCRADDPAVSTFAFLREVIGYDLGAFLARNRAVLRAETDAVLRALLAEAA